MVIHSTTYPSLDNNASTASWGAGGLWKPSYCLDSRVTPWSMETLDELLVQYQSDNRSSHIEIVPTIRLRTRNDRTENTLPDWSTKDLRLNFQHMNIEMLEWQNRIHRLRFPFQDYQGLVQTHGYPYCWLFYSPVLDTPKYLRAMQEEIRKLSSTTTTTTTTASSSSTNGTPDAIFQVKKYTNLQQMVSSARELGCNAVVNCTGIGAQEICSADDPTIIPARGVIAQYKRDCARVPFLEDGSLINDVSITITEPPFASEVEPCYLIPRGDVLLVGGSFQEGDTEPLLREEERYRLRRNAQLLGIDTSRAKPIVEYACFRPSRPTVRVEVDQSGIGLPEGIQVVHNYGSGGSGWTLFIGQAREAVNLVIN